MVEEAEAHAAEDKKEKSLGELGEKVQSEERARIESAISDLKEAVKSDDKGRIDAKARALAEASAAVMQRVYAEEAKAGQGGDGGEPPGGGKPADEDVVDAEFEEVKEDRK
jgi:molecular chaperone DnaK